MYGILVFAETGFKAWVNGPATRGDVVEIAFAVAWLMATLCGLGAECSAKEYARYLVKKSKF